VVLNIGICGASEAYAVGLGVLAHSVHDPLTSKTIYPHLRYEHPFEEVALTMVFEPQTRQNYTVVDMESFAVCKVALQYVSTSQLVVCKVVSDHFSKDIPSKEKVYDWIEAMQEDTLSLCESMLGVKDDSVKKVHEKLSETLQLTKAQSDKLFDACNYFYLRHQKLPSIEIDSIPRHKKEKSVLFQKVIDELTV